MNKIYSLTYSIAILCWNNFLSMKYLPDILLMTLKQIAIFLSLKTLKEYENIFKY